MLFKPNNSTTSRQVNIKIKTDMDLYMHVCIKNRYDRTYTYTKMRASGIETRHCMTE